MPEDDGVLGALAAIFFGLVGLAVLASIFGPKCPKCGASVSPDKNVCDYCKAQYTIVEEGCHIPLMLVFSL